MMVSLIVGDKLDLLHFSPREAWQGLREFHPSHDAVSFSDRQGSGEIGRGLL